MEEGTLYPALWRLEEKKLVEAEWGLSENNRKAKFYRMTVAGKRRLQMDSTNWDAYAIAVERSWAQPGFTRRIKRHEENSHLATLCALARC